MRRIAFLSLALGALVAACARTTPSPEPTREEPVAVEDSAVPAPEPELPPVEPLPAPEPPPPPPPPPRAVAPPPPKAAGLERGTDRPGHDYTNFALDTPDPNGCKIACEQEERCRAFTYTAPGVMGEMAYCSLKDSVPPAKPSSCCVSGVK